MELIELKYVGDLRKLEVSLTFGCAIKIAQTDLLTSCSDKGRHSIFLFSGIIPIHYKVQ